MRQKRFILDKPAVNTQTLEWAINYRNEILRRKVEKDRQMQLERSIIERENAKFKAVIERIGIHADLYK